MISGISEAYDVVQVGITDIGELFESVSNKSESDIKSVRQDDMHILI